MRLRSGVLVGSILAAAMVLALTPAASAAQRPGPARVSVAAGDMQNVVTWSRVRGFRGYYVYRAASPAGPFTLVTRRPVAVDVYADRVGEARDWYYRIVAVNGRNLSAPSQTIANARVSMRRLVGSSGATLRAANGAVTLTVPAGALTATSVLTVDGPASGPAVRGGIRTAPVFRLGPDGTRLASPATLTIRYAVPVSHFQVALVLEQATDLATYDAARSAWTTSQATADTAAGVFTGTLSHFSYWTGAVIQPHGTTPSKAASYCSGICHDLVDAPSSPTVIPNRSKVVCYNCHGNTSALLPPAGTTGPNIQAEFLDEPDRSFTATSSRHPVAEGKLYCTACHNPHADPSASYKVLRTYDAVTGKAIQSTTSTSHVGSEYCWACHGTKASARIEQVDPGYWARSGGDKKTGFAGGPHDRVTAPTPSGIRCLACHADHGASNDALIATSVAGQAVSGNDRTLCLACHTASLGAYGGSADYLANRHSTTTASTKALGTYPGTGANAGDCRNCHEGPHGMSGLPSLLRSDGAALCPACHDAAGLSYPSGYGYRGPGVMAASGHGAVGTESVRSAVLNADGEGFAAWESTTVPTPASPGTPVPPARLAGLRAIDGILTVTKLASSTGECDYQMYRFKPSAPASEITRLTAKWRGFGEELAGYPVSLCLWDRTLNGGAGGWWQCASQQAGSMTTLATSTAEASACVDASGYVYMLAKAVNVRDADIVSGPAIVGALATSMRVAWQTLGLTDAWVDVGLTASYGSAFGSSARTTSHNVLATLPGANLYHYRIRGTSQDGDSYVSEDRVIGVPSPVCVAVPDYANGGPQDVTFGWSDPAPSRDPFTYRFRIWNGAGWSYETFLGSTSTTMSLPSEVYSWQVEAIDRDGYSFGWSNVDSFGIYEPSGSCPFLFTDDGTGYRFEADVMMPGKLANKVSTGYQKPNPQDSYKVRTPPASIDGSWRFKLVEERYEVDYVDRLQLFAADAPAGYEVFSEKPGVGGALKEVRDQLHTVSDPRVPLSATHVNDGADVLAKLASDDGDCVVLNDDRNDFTYQTIELDLGSAATTATQVKLLIDGVSAVPQTPAGMACSARYGPRTKIEVQQADGTWFTVPSAELFMPVPPEFARTYVLDVTKALAHGGPRMRLTFLYKTYLDTIKVDTSPDQPVSLTEAPLVKAELSHHGIDGRSSADIDLYEYVYGPTNGMTAFFPGSYTKHGDVRPLLSAVDDEFVIAGGGDELDLAFQALPAPPPGVSRSLILGTYGFYKDAKVDVTHAVDPLPFSAMSNFPYPAGERYPADAEHQAYLAEWNTRVDGVGTAAVAPLAARVLDTLRESFDGVRALFARVLGTGARTRVASANAHRSLNTDYAALELELSPGGLSGQCPICHAVHGGTDWDGKKLPALRAAADGRTCTANGSGGCHSAPATGAAGLNVYAKVTENADPTSHHDVLPSQHAASGARLACGDCHNPHSDDASSRWSDVDVKSTKGEAAFAKYVDPSGRMYMMLAARHDGVPPAISGFTVDVQTAGPLSPVIRWTTNEAATTWVDYGLTTSYELGAIGGGALTASHVATITSLSYGSGYYFRARTADALGNETVGEQQYYEPMVPPEAPILSAIATVTIDGASSGPGSATMTWTPVASTDGGPVEYRAEIPGVADSGWMSGTAWSSPAALWGGTYQATVSARDALHPLAVSPYSNVATFFVNDVNPPMQSCPDLFTWDGSGFSFVTDVMNNAPIGLPVPGGGLLYPNPYEETRIDPALLRPKDGRYELRLRDNNDEIDFVDRVSLKVVDHPKGTQVFLDDMRYTTTSGVAPPERVFTVRDPRPVRSASYSNIVYWKGTPVADRDVTSELAHVDGVYAPASMYDDNCYTFGLGDLRGAPEIKLVMTGWTEYPEHDVAALRRAAGPPYPQQVLEVQGPNGAWFPIQRPAGFIPGYTKTVVYDLTGEFPDGVTDFRVRLRGLVRTHIDQVLVDTSRTEPVSVREVRAASASLYYKGPSSTHETPAPQIGYDDVRSGYMRLNEGLFTKYGDVLPLVTSTDDEFAIMDTGDEIALSFPAPPEDAGLERTCLIAADGYFQQMTDKVDPKPFHAMSRYPYGPDERYPSDEEHVRYLSEWNTRLHAGESVPVSQGDLVGTNGFEAKGAYRVLAPRLRFGAMLDMIAARISGWPLRLMASVRTLLAPMPLTVSSTAGAQLHHSLNTDALSLRVTGLSGSLTTYTATAGWESVGTTNAVPSPSLPGAAVAPETLARASSVDATHWVTGLTTTDSEYNRQVFAFDVGADCTRTASEVSLAWTGHGEPTPGYETVPVYVWNNETSAWDKLVERVAVSDVTLATAVEAVPSSYCLECHDGAPPSGVVFPSGIVNVAAKWGTTPTDADRHGAFAGIGKFSSGGGSLYSSLGSLAPGLSRGYPAIGCVTCHDPHGNGNRYHLQTTVNGHTGLQIRETGSVEFCKSCHTGTVRQMHEPCAIECHYGEAGHYDDITYLLPNESSDCLACHRHGQGWGHYPDCHGACTGWYVGYSQTF